MWQDLRNVYKANNAELIRTDGRRSRGNFDSLLHALTAAELDWFDSAEYRVDELADARDAFVPDVYGIDRRHDNAAVGP